MEINSKLRLQSLSQRLIQNYDYNPFNGDLLKITTTVTLTEINSKLRLQSLKKETQKETKNGIDKLKRVGEETKLR